MAKTAGSVLLRIPTAIGDGDLVRRAATGDRWSREVLYRRHAGRLLGLATRLLGSRADGEEIVQETFLVAFEKLPSLHDADALPAWLGQIAVNLVRHRLRRLRLMRLLGIDRSADDATLAALAAPGLGPEASAELALLDRALARLAPHLRIAWMLRHVDGLELVEVASVCGCSLATIKRRLAAAGDTVRRHTGIGEGKP
jgi:RNA polymerase sigma-70 factor (ECF subfamily)